MIIGNNIEYDKILELEKQNILTVKNYNLNVETLNGNLKNGNITSEEYQATFKNLTDKFNVDKSETINQIEKQKNILSEKSKDEYQSIKNNKVIISNKIRQTGKKLQSSKNKITKIQSSKILEVAITTGISSALNSLFTRSADLDGYIEDTNKLIDIANKSQQIIDINKASNSINNTLKIINDLESKINKIQSRIKTYSTSLSLAQITLKVLKLTVEAVFSSPSPSKPGVVIALEKINSLSKSVFSIGILLGGIIPQVLNELINFVNEEKSKIKNQITNNNELLAKNNLNLSLVVNSNILTNQLLINNTKTQLGIISDVEYKGFKFAIEEEDNPKFVVEGNKRHYAVAINSIGTSVLRTDPSFVLDTDLLISELKTEIDRLSL